MLSNFFLTCKWNNQITNDTSLWNWIRAWTHIKRKGLHGCIESPWCSIVAFCFPIVFLFCQNGMVEEFPIVDVWALDLIVDPKHFASNPGLLGKTTIIGISHELSMNLKPKKKWWTWISSEESHQSRSIRTWWPRIECQNRNIKNTTTKSWALE